MNAATPFSDLWFDATVNPDAKAYDAAGALSRRLENLPVLLVELDRLVATMPKGSAIGRLVMLSDAESELLVEAVEDMAAKVERRGHAHQEPTDAQTVKALLALRDRLEARHG